MFYVDPICLNTIKRLSTKKPRRAVGRGFELFPLKVGALSTGLQVLFAKAATLQMKSRLPYVQC